MDDHDGERAAGLAAIAICEALIAVLMDRNVLGREDVEELLSEAAQIETTPTDGDIGAQASEIIRDVMEGLTARRH